jgi:hypothetical protein
MQMVEIQSSASSVIVRKPLSKADLRHEGNPKSKEEEEE